MYSSQMRALPRKWLRRSPGLESESFESDKVPRRRFLCHDDKVVVAASGEQQYPISGKWHLSGELGPLVQSLPAALANHICGCKGDAEGATAQEAYPRNRRSFPRTKAASWSRHLLRLPLLTASTMHALTPPSRASLIASRLRLRF